MSAETSEISGCEVCGHSTLLPVLDLGLHPMCDDLVPIGETRRCTEYPIQVMLCARCVTAHLRYQVPQALLFPPSYHFRSRLTREVVDGFASLVDECCLRYGPLEGRTVVDVGCNDGSLLDAFRRAGARTIGIEPTAAAGEARAHGHDVVAEFFSEDVAAAIAARHGRADFIVFANVFAHIENLPGLVRSVRRLMGPHTVVVIENHYLGTILERNQFDTFYHEHPRSYSLTSFTYIASSLGATLEHVQFPPRYGGSIRVFLAAGAPSTGSAVQKAAILREGEFPARFAALQGRLDAWRRSKRTYLVEQVRLHGPLRAKAYPGRASILVKCLELDERMIDAVYEQPGSLKVGHYVPGTRIPIRSDDELFATADRHGPMVNLAWHIPGEIRDYLLEHGYDGDVFDILTANDF